MYRATRIAGNHLKMAIQVFLRSDNPQLHRPQHSASKTLALLVLSALAAKWTDATRTAIQLTSAETWRQCKDRCRRIKRYRETVVVGDSGFDHPWSWRP